ncbi:MAG: hypothetical protein MPK62_12220, partial [Alphaproteobacteria bacterium]|nr:hypothetical protein [Alphaproteobacteria bacterium]
MDDIQGMIDGLSRSSIQAGCPHCGESFKLSEFAMFDGRKKLPDEAKDAAKAMQQVIKQMADELEA